ncbi:PAS domain S-box protein [Natrinema thermotolerans]|uniref:histidine kinase n=1 Tax=Natrinema thermotolerans TaxID=121872 RepID=A0AAF0PBZ4_9EURY|nr:PAS domain S-box protein [Natrinema thermotolerans]QCC58182.1 PAS domain S-box protein [Natrinema thermotolerans]WMT09293.1 PAS domain S-box protein [Natrinema thermotolerans]
MDRIIGPDTRAVVIGTDTGDAERALEERGVSVASTRSVAECLDRLGTADCIVIAGSGSAVNPVACCRRLRDRRADVPIVVFPDDGSERLAGDVVAAGADGYVPRSQGTEPLLERLRKLLADRENGNRDPSDTEHKRPFEAVPSSTADPSSRLELLVEQSPLAIIEWNLEFGVRNWNPAATELFGYTANEAMGQVAPDFLVPEGDREAVREYWERLVDGDPDGLPSRQVNRNRCKDGTTITCEWFNTPIVEDGEIVSVLSFGQDITADVKRATALEALQETTRELLRAESTDEIADIVMAATEDVIDRPLGSIRYYDEETDRLELAGITSELDRRTGDISSVGGEYTSLWNAYTEGESTVVEEPSTDRVPYDVTIGMGNAVLQPLGDHGILSVASPATSELDEAERNLLNVLATTAEAALDRAARERELERTKTVVETVGDCVYQLDHEGRFVTVNDTMATTTGYDRDDLLGEHVSTILTDESVARGQRYVEELLADDDRRVATYEITLTNTDGTETPAEVNMALLTTDGELEGTVGIARDISDRKRMERQLVDRKAKIQGLHGVASRLDGCESRAEIYDVAIEAAEDVLDFDGCVIDMVSGDELVTEAASSALTADPEDRTPIDGCLASRTYRTGQLFRLDDVTGARTPRIEGCRSVLTAPIGDRAVFQAVSREPSAFSPTDEELTELLLSHVADALDRIAFEERLRTERDRFAALFENVPDGVVSVSNLSDGPIVEAVNPAFERLFGYEESTLVGESLDEFVVPTDRTDEAETLNRRGSRGKVGEAEVKRRTVNGLRDFRLRVVPIEMDGSSDRAFGLYTDITERKQRQKRLEILNRVLRHDLRNGMNIIEGCAEMLADAVGEDEYVETIRNRTNELVGLAEKTRAVERVLDCDQAPTGPLDISASIDRAIDRLEDAAPAVEVTRTLPDGVQARADEYLETAIYQVLENAVEHSDRDRPAVDVTLRDCPDDELLTLSIADDGPGIPDEERELLEGEREITQLRHGSGLGLWLVNWVVTQTGGQLSFADNDPRGTVVTLEVPRADAEPIRSASDEPATGD